LFAFGEHGYSLRVPPRACGTRKEQ
jgi:hypothetical protein